MGMNQLKTIALQVTYREQERRIEANADSEELKQEDEFGKDADKVKELECVD